MRSIRRTQERDTPHPDVDIDESDGRVTAAELPAMVRDPVIF